LPKISGAGNVVGKEGFEEVFRYSSVQVLRNTLLTNSRLLGKEFSRTIYSLFEIK